MTIVIRYLDGNEVREDFLSFSDLHDENYGSSSASTEPTLTGEVIGKSVLKHLKEFDLKFENCVGIGTDGCAVMSSLLKGAVVEIQKECVNAVWSPCFNHALNLTLSKTSTVPSIRNCMGTLGEVVNFFNFPKRNHVLTQILGSQLVSLCETRWVERHDAVLTFLEHIEKVIEALEFISDWNDQATASKAHSLLIAVTNCECIVALHCIAHVFSYTTSLSQLLQKQDLCVERASEVIKNLTTRLKEKRENCEESFKQIYDEALVKMETLNVIPTLPRLSGRQNNRANPPCTNPEEYYRRSMFIPMMDNMLMDLSTRFERHTINCLFLFDLLPKLVTKKTEAKLRETVKVLHTKYSKLVHCASELRLFGELSMWKTEWESAMVTGRSIPPTFLEALDSCDEVEYPIIHKLLRILGTLPASVASAERSFSCLKRLKTWLRTRMTQERLNGIALLHINREIELTIEEVIDCFAKGNRKLEFVI